MLHPVLPLALALMLLVAGSGDAPANMRGSDYRALGHCGPYPRAVVTTPAWACVGIVAGAADGLRMPRNILEWRPGSFVITDMGSWTVGTGRVLMMTLGPDGSPRFRTLFARLDLPHGLGRGPDGLIYIGESARIWRFDPARPDASREIVIDGMPSAGLHRLKHFVFDKAGNLVINLGAPTDRCETGDGKAVQTPCPDVEGDAPQAALWLAEFDRPGGKVVSFRPLARGLRKSMALAVHPQSGLILQAENSIDLEAEDQPPEEINVIRRGRHYGWPYCTGSGDRVPGARWRQSCKRYEKPVLLLPAHAAPLGMLFYDGALFPELTRKLIVSLHGYRANGHRIIALDTRRDGRPLRPKRRFGLAIIDDWTATTDVRPRGAPVGLTVAADGSLWFVEDRNKTVMVLLRTDRRSTSASRSLPDPPSQTKISAKPAAGTPPASWRPFYERALHPRCSQCHAEMQSPSPELGWQALQFAGWIDGGPAASWKLVRAMRGTDGLKPMPPPGGLADDALGAAELRSFLASVQ